LTNSFIGFQTNGQKMTMSSFVDRLFANKLVYWVGEKIDNGRWEYVYQRYRRKYEISPTFRFNGPHIHLIDDGRIILGDASYIGRGSHLQSSRGYEIRIGKKCAISYYVMMYTMNRMTDQDFSKSVAPQYGNIGVGDYCWIGVHVYINQGVSIGDNVVIGANSVVTRNIPPHCVAAGSPARVLKFKSYLRSEDTKKLAKQYWESLSTEMQQLYSEVRPHR
jgi:maltose O-acetyltransferase